MIELTKNRIFPTWEQISSFKTPLTEGELSLAKYMDKYLPQDWEIFIQPYLNGDRPDLVILNKDIGLMIIEVKDWNPDFYNCKETIRYDKKKKRKYKVNRFFVTDNRGTWPIPSPIHQVERYRENLIGLYIPEIGESIDQDNRQLEAFKVGIYFQNMSTKQAYKLVQTENVQISAKRCRIVIRQTLPDKF